MAPKRVPDETNELIRKLKADGMTHQAISDKLDVSIGHISKVVHAEPDTGTSGVYTLGQKTGVLTTKSLHIRTAEQACEHHNIDMRVWKIVKRKIGSTEVTMGLSKSGTGRPETFTNFNVHVWLERKTPERMALETILERIERSSPVCKKIKRVIPPRNSARQVLEVSLFDLHLGCHAFEPAADKAWDIETAKTMAMAMLERILTDTAHYGPFDYILYPVGNDFYHADGVFHATTRGTPQPEMDSWHNVFVEGEGLLIQMIDRLKERAPVQVLVVPGNHARQTEFCAGRILKAYYRNDKNVQVDASSSPYKFHHYGVNLIGFEHGHSAKPPIRLASLMANECADVWGQTRYREWHLGDQHRKGSAKPSVMEEQGVSVEYLPGLTPPNEWHRIKSYNWQKRAAMAFVWDKKAGPVARLQVNVDSYTGKVMG